MPAFLAAGSLAAAVVAAVIEPAGALKPAFVAPVPHAAVAEHRIYGFVESLSGTTLIIKNRSGRPVVVDAHLARANVHLFAGRAVIVFGPADARGVIHAVSVWRTFPDAAHWPPDR